MATIGHKSLLLLDEAYRVGALCPALGDLLYPMQIWFIII